MVRLKEFEGYHRLTLITFQFHYGTIKRSGLLNASAEEKIFQFHYGTIKSLCTDIRIDLNTKFQFHYGTIKRSLRETMCYVRRISIPLWYD